jgi:hypothetical protein
VSASELRAGGGNVGGRSVTVWYECVILEQVYYYTPNAVDFYDQANHIRGPRKKLTVRSSNSLLEILKTIF